VIGLGIGLGLGNASYQTARAPKQMTKYLFVDGGFLESMIPKTQKFYGLPISVDDVEFEWIAGGYQRTFYYDALPVQKERQEQVAYEAALGQKQRLFSRINATPYMHTREGITRNRLASRARQQKGVDILLAIDVFKHASLRNMTEAHIMTTDLDFFPLFEALRDTPVSVHLHCLCDETSAELMALADVVRPITYFTVLNWIAHPRRDEFVHYVAGVDDFHHMVLFKKGFLGSPVEFFNDPADPSKGCVALFAGQTIKSDRLDFIVADLEHRHRRRLIFP
jgi:uncharacterized LabA/DUF88 family protein